MRVLTDIELGILIIFTAEIVIRCYGIGIKKYFKDKWLIWDGFVIVLSIALVFIELYADIENNNFTNASKVLRGVFRFLRIILLFRKVSLYFYIRIFAYYYSLQ